MRKILSAAAAVMAAVLLCAPCAAEDNQITLPASADEQELDLQTSGDYIYVMLTSAEDSSKKAVCIEKYTGTETNVVIPDSINGYPVVMLGDQCFGGNHIAERIELPKSLEALGEFTFAECTALKEYAVAEGNPTYEAAEGILYAENKTVLLRYPAAKKTESYTVPENVITIGNVAFAYSDISSFTLPDSLLTIGKMAFADCKNLTEITVPAQVTKIPDYCFYRCKNLKNADLSNNITGIGMAAFACTGIEKMEMPTSLVTIGEAAFADTPMKTVTLSAKVTDIGYSAFGYRLAPDQSLVSTGEFVLRGPAGSAAEKYAKDEENKGAVTFEALGTQSTAAADKPAQTEPAKEEGMSAFRLTGIIVCSAALAGLVILAVVLGIKRGKKQPKSEGSEAKSEKPNAEEDSE